MNYVDFFYKNIIKNLSLKKVFIHEIKKKYQYSDIKKFYFSFYKIINQFKSILIFKHYKYTFIKKYLGTTWWRYAFEDYEVHS